jgi:chromosomal replication initiator protein
LRYFPAETFTNDLYQALRTKTIDRFKEIYRSLDCMIVDDIQFIAGKEYAQEEFFHTFNALYLSGKQIILASDRKPSEIRDLEDRLISRFSGGLNVDIQLPDYEMRLSILKQKSEDKNLKISPQALNYLAENNPGNIRDLEGKLQEAALLAISQQQPEITLEILAGHQTPISPLIHNQNPRHILSVCAKNLNIKTGDLIGKSRKKDLIYARHLTAYILLTVGKLPLQQVGEILGGRDHTSIIHARDKIHQALSTNTQLSSLFHQISSQLTTN